MEEILKHPFLLLLAGFFFGGGGVGLAVLTYWLYRKKHKAEAEKLQGEADKILRENAENNQKRFEEQMLKFNTLFIENETNKHLLKVKTDSNSELYKIFQEVLIKQGRQELSEEICQKAVAELKKKNAELEERLSSVECQQKVDNPETEEIKK